MTNDPAENSVVKDSLTTRDNGQPGSLGLAPGSVRMPRARSFRNPHGDAMAWFRARRKRWWLTEPIRLGPQKLHIYGVLSRRTWRSGIRSIEVTADRVTVLYSPNAACEPHRGAH